MSMNKARPVGIGIIGTSFGAAVQLPGFIGIPDAQVIGIVSRDSKRSTELKEKFNLKRVFAAAQELIDSEEVDFVSIATPPAAQAELVRAAIRSGKDVLCEKPFALNSLEARNLLSEAEKSGIVHSVDFEFRELPAFKMLKSQLEGRRIGTIQSAEFKWIVGTWADPKRPWRWQCDRSLGGGVLNALGVHLFDTAEWLFGPIRKIRAKTGIKVSQRPDAITGGMKPITGEDHAVIQMSGEKGMSVGIVLSNVDPAWPGLEMDIRGENGTLVLRSSSQAYGRGLSVEEIMNGKEPKVLLAAKDSPIGIDSRIPPFQSLASRLIAAVRKRDKDFRPSFYEGLRAQMLQEGALASAATGNWVEIAGPVP